MAYIKAATLLSDLYKIETSLAGLLSDFGYSFAPIYLGGNIADPGLYNIADVTPQTTESVTYKTAGSSVSDTYTGTTLWNLLKTAGGTTTTAAKNDVLSKYVIATGSDGYTAVYSAGELAPQFGNQPVLAATSDTSGQLGPTGSDGLSRIVVPNDIAGGRYVSDLVSLHVGSLPEPGPTGSGGTSPSAELTGAVKTPETISPETLSGLNQSQTVTATYMLERHPTWLNQQGFPTRL